MQTCEWLTPLLVRVVLGGGGLTGFELPDATDSYINVAIPPAGSAVRRGFDPAAVRADHTRVLAGAPPLHRPRWDAAPVG